jgi:ribosome-associated heat shock protein Hsp15
VTVRLDKWLWAARFFKTRSLATDEISKGRVRINGVVVKASREPKPGDEVCFRTGYSTRTVVVKSLSDVRGPAPQAALLYEETPESLAARQNDAEERRLLAEPAHSIIQGRPTKKDRRHLDVWGDRWSASLND